MNVTLGNANDNGGTTVTPSINLGTGNDTINVAFTGSGSQAVVQLDLQDSDGVEVFNITRVSDGTATVTIDNMQGETDTISVSNSGQATHVIDFAYDDEELSAADDSVDLTLNNVDVAQLIVDGRGATPSEGFETHNITVSTNSEIATYTAEDAQEIVITGAGNLSLDNTGVATSGIIVEAVRHGAALDRVSGSLTSIDASAMTGDLTLSIGGEIDAGLEGTSGVPIQMSVASGTGNDTMILTDGATVGGTATTNTDTISGGAGTDTLIMVGSAAINATTAGGNVSGIEALEIRTGHDSGVGVDAVEVDFDAFDADLANAGNFITIRNEGMNDAVAGVFTSAAENATVTLTDLSAQQAGALRVLHGTTGNNGLDDLVINADMKDASGTSDTVAVRYEDGVNSDVRFNFTLNANPNVAAQNVENITITDADTESNTIRLSDFETHTGTITISGGQAGDFINLDTDGVTVNAGLYQYDQTGGATDVAGVLDEGTGANVRLGAATITASAAVSNVIVRVDTNDASVAGAQSITMGSGNDTVIFDVLSTNTTVGASTATAGLTISDTVAGGTGADTLAIDGNGVDIRITASEWTNVTGFETVHLVGNGQADDNASVELGGTNAYQLTLSNSFIAANAANGTRIAIVNDNGAANTTPSTISANAGVTIIATALDATHNFSFDGQETNETITDNGVRQAGETFQTEDRFVFSDVNLNANAIVDGGAVVTGAGSGAANAGTSTGGTDAGHLQSADILEVQNSAVVSIGDLSGISNVGTIQATNTTAVNQTISISLNNAVVDAMVNSTAAASDQATTAISAADRIVDTHEVLDIRAIDNGVTTTTLVVDGSGVTNGALWLDIRGAGGNDTIVGGGGADYIVGGDGTDTMTGGGGADIFAFAVGDNAGADGAAVADVITDFVAGTDKLQFTGFTDIVSVQQGAVQIAVTALAAGATDAQIATAMALANTTNLGVSFAVFNGNTYVYAETTGATGTHVEADNIFIQLTGVTVLPLFANDVIA